MERKAGVEASSSLSRTDAAEEFHSACVRVSDYACVLLRGKPECLSQLSPLSHPRVPVLQQQ